MLFDLRGKRRRTVQATYLTPAGLMGGGLVLFGIGSSTNGGLGDLFKGGGGSNKANSVVENKIKAAQRTLATQPKNEAALASLVRNKYLLASASADPNTSTFSKDAIPDLQAADSAWQRYLAAAKKPDPSLATTAFQATAQLAQLVPAKARDYSADAASAAEVIAAAHPNTQTYLLWTQYAAGAGQLDKAKLAGRKAVELAPKSQQKAVKQQVTQFTAGSSASAPAAGGG